MSALTIFRHRHPHTPRPSRPAPLRNGSRRWTPTLGGPADLWDADVRRVSAEVDAIGRHQD